MSRAIAPAVMPELPEGVTWARSLKRAGSMFHAHRHGFTLCESVLLDRNASVEAGGLGALQHFGCCPRCIKLAHKK